jgi:hypothetical protein
VVERAKNGKKHQGHVDEKLFEEIREFLFSGRYKHPDFGGKSVAVDTTDFGKIPYGSIYATVREELGLH